MEESKSTTSHQSYDVVIVGGGPVGNFLSLALVKAGLETLIIEAEPEVAQSARAIVYFPAVLLEFQKLGLLDDMLAAGYKNTEGLFFRTPPGLSDRYLGTIPCGQAPGSPIDYAVQLGQHSAAGIFLKHAKAYPNFHIQYGTQFESLRQDDFGVVIEARKQDGTQVRFRSQFVVGCDGKNSAVRGFLNIPYEGYTWEDFRFLAINIKYPYFEKVNYPGINIVVDEKDWAIIARTGSREEGMWRIATGINPKIASSEVHKHLSDKLERLLPGPRPLNYELVQCSPYWAHEKVAKTYRSGRVLLCGDAAHVNNPLTAMGLTTGLIDCVYLSRILPRAFTPEGRSSWEQILEKYCTLRRDDFVNHVQPFTRMGKLRMHSMDPEVVADRKDFFKLLNTDPRFGMFVANSRVKRIPDDMFSITNTFATSFAQAWDIVRHIPAMIYWKITTAFC
jgi:2-polyprenyl-6-methoxyphenol hydroxylase-like FAD-dependent oxidoreductase